MSENETIQLFIELVTVGSLVGVFLGYLIAFFSDER